MEVVEENKRLLVEKNKESDNRWLVMCLPPEINDLQLMSKEETLHKRKKNYNSKNKENKEKDQQQDERNVIL